MVRKRLLRVILYVNNSRTALPPRFNISTVEFQLSSSFTQRLSDKSYNHALLQYQLGHSPHYSTLCPNY